MLMRLSMYCIRQCDDCRKRNQSFMWYIESISPLQVHWMIFFCHTSEFLHFLHRHASTISTRSMLCMLGSFRTHTRMLRRRQRAIRLANRKISEILARERFEQQWARINNFHGVQQVLRIRLIRIKIVLMCGFEENGRRLATIKKTKIIETHQISFQFPLTIDCRH